MLTSSTLILNSPYAKRGYIDHTAADHTSLLKFIETTFGLTPSHRETQPPTD